MDRIDQHRRQRMIHAPDHRERLLQVPDLGKDAELQRHAHPGTLGMAAQCGQLRRRGAVVGAAASER